MAQAPDKKPEAQIKAGGMNRVAGKTSPDPSVWFTSNGVTGNRRGQFTRINGKVAQGFLDEPIFGFAQFFSPYGYGIDLSQTGATVDGTQVLFPDTTINYDIPEGDMSYILINDTKASGTDGGTFTSGSFVTRTLNTEVSDSGGYATLSSNQVTLAPGTYRIRVQAPAFTVNVHKAILYNVTAGATQIAGTSEHSSQVLGQGNDQTSSVIVGRFTIGSPTVFEVRHRGDNTAVSSGFGVASSYAGVSEVYTIFEAWRE